MTSSELFLQRLVSREARALGLHVHHCDMRQSQAGFPDLVIFSVKGVLWRELKIHPNRPAGPQRAVGYTLSASGQDYKVWTNLDWQSGQIMKELKEIS